MLSAIHSFWYLQRWRGFLKVGNHRLAEYRFPCIYSAGLNGQYSAMASTSGVKARGLEQKVRILLADDHDNIRKTVRSVLETHPRFEVIAEAVDGQQAIEEAAKLVPDVVVLNVTMPVLNGYEAARVIKARLPHSAIVILSSNADKRFVEEAKKVGARAYVAKSRVGAALVTAIENAIAGGDFVLVE